MPNPFREHEQPWPIEDGFVRITPAQVNYVEILRNDLAMSIASRNAAIINLLGNLAKHTIPGVPFDIWSLSKREGSRVIDKFKEWKDDRKGTINKISRE